MTKEEIFLEENKKYQKELSAYIDANKYIDEDGDEHRKIPEWHKGYNFSAAYIVIERAMERWADIRNSG